MQNKKLVAILSFLIAFLMKSMGKSKHLRRIFQEFAKFELYISPIMEVRSLCISSVKANKENVSGQVVCSKSLDEDGIYEFKNAIFRNFTMNYHIGTLYSNNI